MITAAARRALAIDTFAIVLFVAIGRRSHNEQGNVLIGAAKVAAPFLVALVLSWVVTRARADPFSVRTGVVLWIATVLIGLMLRKVVFDGGIAIAFVIVTTVTLGIFLQGWRGLWRWRSTR